MTLIKKTLFLFTLLALVSCAGMKKEKNESMTKVVEAKKYKTVDKLAKTQDPEKALKSVVDEAMKIGDKAVSFLAGDLYIKASDASLRKDSATAALIFKYLVKMKPNDLYLKKRYAIELIRINQLPKAKEILKSVYKFQSKDEAILMILAGVHTTLNEKAEAKKLYKRVLTLYPKNEEACIFYAKSFSAEGKIKKAKSIINKCMKKDPKNGIYSYFKGKLDANKGKWNLALKEFKKSLKVDPKFYQSALAIGLYYEEKEQFAHSISVYKKFLKKNPSSYSILNRLVQVYFSLGRYKDVLPYAERLSSLDASDLNLKVRLGILYTDARRYEDAKGVFKEILAVVPSSDKVLYYLGSLYLQTGEADRAVEYFSRIESTSTLYHETNLQIAKILQALAEDSDKPEKSSRASKFISFIEEKSKEKDAQIVELRVMLAGFYENGGQLDKAISQLKSVRKESKYNEGHDYYLAALYERNNNFKAARSIIEAILVKNPKNPHALNFLGYSLLERGEELETAFKYISKAVELKPNDGYIRDSLGWYYYKTGQFDKALVEIKKAWTLVKSDVVITKHLAMVYLELKNYAKAKEFYVEALRNCKVESERAEVIKDLGIIETMRLPASENE